MSKFCVWLKRSFCFHDRKEWDKEALYFYNEHAYKCTKCGAWRLVKNVAWIK